MANLALIGASGAVGLEVMTILNERKDIQLDSLHLFATASSAGNMYKIRNIIHTVKEYKGSEQLIGIDYVILATPSKVSSEIVKQGRENNDVKCVFIDNSSFFRLTKHVPLVIPEINFEGCDGSVVIANPNCVTIILLMALAPLHFANKIKRIDLVTMQSASGAGIKGMQELKSQAINYPAKKFSTEFFGRQYHMNIFSHNSEIDPDSGFNGEELKVIKETEKILNVGKGEMEINVTCMRVPVLRSHTEVVTVEFHTPIDEETVREILHKAEGVTVMDDRKTNTFPEPHYLSGKDEVFVGRIRKVYSEKDEEACTKYQFHIVGDQLRKGAATNALQIYERLVR